MGRPPSVIYSDIYITKTVVEPSKPQFHNRFVDDIINKRYNNWPDNIFQALNRCYFKIKYNIEKNLDEFLYKKIIQKNDIVATEVTQKDKTDTVQAMI